jgi:hypothetical protein
MEGMHEVNEIQSYLSERRGYCSQLSEATSWKRGMKVMLLCLVLGTDDTNFHASTNESNELKKMRNDDESRTYEKQACSVV